MSSQLKEKQQQTDNKREFEADQLFNQHLFRTLAYAGAGFGAGMVASIFLKQKKMLTLLGTSAGAVYGGQSFMNDLKHFRSFQDYNNQDQQSHTLKREDQTSTKNWESFMPKQDSISQNKRFGGSDDDNHDDKESKSNFQPKSGEVKRPEQQPYGANANKKYTSSTTTSHNKEDDKSSYEFGKNNGQNATTSSHDRENDKSSQQFGKQQSNSSKSSSHHEGNSKDSSHHKESDKSSRDQHKNETQKSPSKGKEQESSHKQSERSESSKHESKSDSKGEGQQLQDFKSNTKEAGRPAPGDSEKYRGSERPRNTDKSLGNLRDQQNRVEQDRWGDSKHSGNKMKLEHPNDTTAGSQFNGDNLSAKSQVNAVIE